jgi:hypothetical protein
VAWILFVAGLENIDEMLKSLGYNVLKPEFTDKKKANTVL